MDMEKDLQNSKAVLVDIGAPRAVIEAFMEHYVVGQCPLVLVTTQAGCNDRKKQLATQIIDQCGPSTITGSLGDIFAISQEILEKGMCVWGGGGGERRRGRVRVQVYATMTTYRNYSYPPLPLPSPPYTYIYRKSR